MSGFVPTNDAIDAKNLNESPAEVTQIAAATTGLKPPIDVEKKKKKRDSFGIFKAAISLLRAKSKDKEKKKKSIAKQNSVTASDNATWTKLVGSIRPLHMQEVTESPTPSIASDSPSPAHQPRQPESPACSSSSAGTLSQYASALSLLDLYNNSDEEEEEKDPDEVFDALCGDEMIDAKADEFIAQFYKQIQLQNHHRHHFYRQN